MEHKSDDDTDCNWYMRYNNQKFGTETGGLGNKRTSGDDPNYNIVEIGQNTEKSPGDLVTCCNSHSCEKQSANIGVKNSQKSKKIKRRKEKIVKIIYSER